VVLLRQPGDARDIFPDRIPKFEGFKTQLRRNGDAIVEINFGEKRYRDTENILA